MFWARVKIQISQIKHLKNEEWDDENNPWAEKNNLRSSEKNKLSIILALEQIIQRENWNYFYNLI